MNEVQFTQVLLLGNTFQVLYLNISIFCYLILLLHYIYLIHLVGYVSSSEPAWHIFKLVHFIGNLTERLRTLVI